ncbi:MAG TPA: inositol monophosphatase family protein [Verrucomicrobiae bacterium]|nr:inositol monophosphatase family protein [Verrucomicrobiae bacterium]
MLETAIEAAAEAGKLLRKNFGSALNVDEATHHDIKLEIDKQSQQLITRVILADYPDHCVLGEEGVTGNPNADARWVVDPLDGTVNYFYGIPHYAVSIAAQVRRAGTGPASSQAGTLRPGSVRAPVPPSGQWETVAGVVLDPELDELFVSETGKPAMLHGHPIHVSERAELSEAIVAIGFFKSTETIDASLQDFRQMIHKVRKMRLMGAAALDLAYVACGRYDAYIEYGIKLWDIAAGVLILENAGGRAESRPNAAGGPHAFDVRMWNGKLRLEELNA